MSGEKWVRSNVLLARPEGMSREEFNDHWLNVHGQIAKDFPHVIRYSELHLVDSDTVGDVEGHDLGIDGIVDFVCDSKENIPKIWETEVGKPGIEDAKPFIGALREYQVEEHVIVDQIGVGKLARTA
jgi:EthD domain